MNATRRAGPGTRVVTGALVALLGAAACETATDLELIDLDALGVLSGEVYLDLNGSGGFDVEDQGIRGVAIRIVSPDSGSEILRTETDSLGAYLFDEVPLGQYELDILTDVEGDSLVIVESPGGVFSVSARDSLVLRLGLSYPTVTLGELVAMAPGTRVFTHGIALNARDAFGDGVVHIKETDRYLRMTDVERSTIGVGDSIRVLGRTAMSSGRPVLDVVTPFVLVAGAAVPFPISLSTRNARLAQGGTLDAALVQIEDASITSVSGSQSEGFVVRVNDGSGTVDIQIQAYLQADPDAFPAGTAVGRATGLLRPSGDGDWDLYLRNMSDLLLSGG